LKLLNFSFYLFTLLKLQRACSSGGLQWLMGSKQDRRLCMKSRDIRTQGKESVISAMLDELLSNLALRTEFLALAREA
jgi:GTP cyclohydrolase I